MTAENSTLGFVRTERFETEDILDNHVFGFWIYLMSDLILFAAVFATFAVFRHSYAGGPTGKELFNLTYTLGETMFLLASSAACGLTWLSMHNERKGAVMLGLAVTFLLGLGFLSMEISEFHSMILEGNGPDRSAFLSAFFTLVGTHGSHVTLGLIWMAIILGQVAGKGLIAPVRSRLIRLIMFWHFLDIVWIGIFTFVYLMGVM